MRNQMQMFMANLAVTDLFVALGGVCPQIVWNLTVGFYAPDPVCKLVKYMSSAITYASSFALVVLSIDRAEAVCRPLRATSSKISNKTQARILIAGSWVAACLCGIPGLVLARKVQEGTKEENCYLNFTNISPQVYLTLIAVSVFLVPAFIITVCHVIMVSTIWRASRLQSAAPAGNTQRLFRKRVQRRITTTCKDNEDGSAFRLDITQNDEHQKSSIECCLRKARKQPAKRTGCIPRAKVKTVKMTCLIVSAYIICWCPFMIWNLLVTYGVIKRTAPHLMKYTPIIQHLVPLNSSANPIIFWIFNAKHVRKRKPATATSFQSQSNGLTGPRWSRETEMFKVQKLICSSAQSSPEYMI
ncbi:unnamed protein product [Dicrocoelium dendriticum]|nr:unnamed protein product [Dicrocoelium dendriticum]